MNSSTGHTRPPGTITLVPGPVANTWCHLCKAWTRYTGQLLVLTSDGVESAGAWAWCETCEPGGERQ